MVIPKPCGECGWACERKACTGTGHGHCTNEACVRSKANKEARHGSGKRGGTPGRSATSCGCSRCHPNALRLGFEDEDFVPLGDGRSLPVGGSTRPRTPAPAAQPVATAAPQQEQPQPVATAVPQQGQPQQVASVLQHQLAPTPAAMGGTLAAVAASLAAAALTAAQVLLAAWGSQAEGPQTQQLHQLQQAATTAADSPPGRWTLPLTTPAPGLVQQPLQPATATLATTPGVTQPGSQAQWDQLMLLLQLAIAMSENLRQQMMDPKSNQGWARARCSGDTVTANQAQYVARRPVVIGRHRALHTAQRPVVTGRHRALHAPQRTL